MASAWVRLLRLRTKAIYTPFVRADDNFPVRHGGRAFDWLAHFVRPDLFAILQSHDVEPSVIRTHDDFVAANHGRAIHFSACREVPNLFAILAIEAVEEFVASAKQNAIRCNGGRGKVRKISVAKS